MTDLDDRLIEIYDRVTGPIGSRLRVFLPGSDYLYYDGTLVLRLYSDADDRLDAIVIESNVYEVGTAQRTIRWAAIESIVVIPEKSETPA